MQREIISLGKPVDWLSKPWKIRPPNPEEWKTCCLSFSIGASNSLYFVPTNPKIENRFRWSVLYSAQKQHVLFSQRFVHTVRRKRAEKSLHLSSQNIQDNPVHGIPRCIFHLRGVQNIIFRKSVPMVSFEWNLSGMSQNLIGI